MDCVWGKKKLMPAQQMCWLCDLACLARSRFLEGSAGGCGLAGLRSSAVDVASECAPNFKRITSAEGRVAVLVWSFVRRTVKLVSPLLTCVIRTACFAPRQLK